MSKFDYGAYFGPILPLADALREDETRCWGDGGEADKRPAEYVLYLGCNVLRTVALAEIIVAILSEMEVDFVALGGPATCCGVVHHANGDGQVSEKIMRQTLEKFEGYAPKALLTYCPSCHRHMDRAFAETEIIFDVPYLHVTEFIIDNLDRLRFRNRVERRVFLHAHGHGDQAAKDARFARAILEAVPGLEVVGDADADGWGADCGNLEIRRIGAERHAALMDGAFAAARDAGADAVAAVYHSCYRTFTAHPAAEEVGLVHYTMLIAEALGLPARDEAFARLKREGDPEAALRRLEDRAAARGVGKARLRATLQTHFGKG